MTPTPTFEIIGTKAGLLKLLELAQSLAAASKQSEPDGAVLVKTAAQQTKQQATQPKAA